MAFNLAQYNLNPFNVQGSHVKWIKALGSETVNAFVGSALQIYTSAIGNERVSEQIVGAPTKFFRGKGTETVSEAVAEAQPTVLLYLLYRENVGNEIDLSAEIAPPVIADEVITAETDISADIYPTAEMGETVDADTMLGADIYTEPEGYELISESASLEVIDEKVCVLTTTLRPGQRIIVDAETYTVLLDAENAIEIQSGDWIDELNRDTVDIVIGAASGVANLTARLIYTERYL